MVKYVPKEMSELKQLCYGTVSDPNELYIQLMGKLAYAPQPFVFNDKDSIKITSTLISLDGKEKLLLYGRASQWRWKNKLERILSRAYQNSLPVIVRGHYDVCDRTPSLFVEKAELLKENNKESTKQNGKLSLAKTLEREISLADGGDLSQE